MSIYQNSDFEAPIPGKNRIAEGSFGSVYRLHKINSNQFDPTLYAVKIPHETDFELFMDEIKAISKLKYKTIIHLYGITLDEPPYIILEYLPCGTIKKYINNAKKMSNNFLFNNLANKMILIIGIALGMRYLHSKDIAHRDLKPENVLLDSNYYPVITDFGLSKTNSGTSCKSNSDGGWIGTTNYMAPELMDFSNNNINYKKTDVYAFAMTIYAILYNRIPFLEEIEADPNYVSFPRKIMNNLRPPLNDEIVSPSMNELIKRCWDGDQKDRPNFQEICECLLKEKDEMIKRGEISQEEEIRINNFIISCNDSSKEEIQNDFRSKKGINEGIELKKKGDKYFLGNGVDKNLPKALVYYRQSSFYDNPDAYFAIGNFYEKGYSVDQDYVLAMTYYRKAADKGNIEALFSIGNFYKRGKGVPKDYTEAMNYFQQSWEKGNSNGLNMIGYLYEKGLGVEKNYEKAMEYYQKAANEKNAQAMYNVGILYYSGRGVKRDYSKALQYFDKAAKEDFTIAQDAYVGIFNNISCTIL